MNQNISHHFYILLLLAGVVSACTPAVHESRHTLAVADSLRVNEGRLYDDSLALAEAYTLLGHWRLIYPDDYARACYYYGRMLRHRGDQVAAMRAFINGTHAPYMQRVVPLPWFSDYHILGRIYSNMGTMCHLSGNFDLSYKMYELSSEQFNRSQDSTAYYYALNSMAIEFAEQNFHDETLFLLSIIQHECTDANVQTKTWETKAILYRNIELYDSVIYSVRELQAHEYKAVSGYVLLAQAYWHLQQNDSAIHYAKQVMTMPNASDQERYNMLYILTYNDYQIGQEEKMQLHEKRDDIDKEILDPLQTQLTHAVDNLLQDQNKRPYYINLGLLLLSLCVVCGITWMSVILIKRHQQQLYADTERERQKQFELQQQQKDVHAERITTIEKNCEAIYCSFNWKETLNWRDYDALCKTADQYFLLLASKLRAQYNLDEKEVRLCILILLNKYSNKQLAQYIHYSESGIGTFKYRISRKFNIPSKEIRNFLLDLAILGYTE